ncbi:MAG: hypothetical protein ACHQPI_07525 [Thermoanaerobaculia bacterium]
MQQLQGNRGTIGSRGPWTALLAILAAGSLLGGEKPLTPFQPVAVPGEDFLLRPEAERPLQSLVIGVQAQRSGMAAIPGVEPGPSPDDRLAVRLRQELNAINVEIDHGRLLAFLPAHSRLFVAIPDPKGNPEASGHEEEDFRFYLEQRVGWSRDEIARRVRFFSVPYPVLFPRDLSEILGLDSRHRLVLGLGRDADPVYARALERLVGLFPDSFRLIRLRGVGVRNVNTEGGDIGLVWTPEGRVGLLVGRHRVLRYLEHHYGEDLTAKPVSRERIEEARAAFQAAFFGVEVIILGEEVLSKPELGSEQLFHADMVVSVMRGRGRAVAFVPTFRGAPIDAITHVPVASDVVSRVQSEYDVVAAQMARRGYAVVRLPYADHPVRSPVNSTPFVEPATGQPWVLLGRYPEHLVWKPGGPIPLFPLQDAMDDLTERVLHWRKSALEEDGRLVSAALARVWREWDQSLLGENPIFEEQKRLYEENGIRVRAVPMIPSGAGGIHCLLLR